jgi:LysR family hydrogen peroxide-inducible transcriptional activator
VIASLAHLVPRILVGIKKAFPNSSLSLHEGITESLVRELKSGMLDAVVAADTVSENVLTKIPLFFEPFVLAAPKQHSILSHSKVRLSDLKASEMVLLDEGHCLRDQALGFCPASRRGHPMEYHATSVDTLHHLVACGAGYTLLPGLAVKDSRLRNLVSYLKFENPRVGRKIFMFYRQKSPSLVSLQRLAETLKQTVPYCEGVRSLKEHS